MNGKIKAIAKEVDIQEKNIAKMEDGCSDSDIQMLLLKSIANHLVLQSEVLIAIMEKLEAAQVSDNK